MLKLKASLEAILKSGTGQGAQAYEAEARLILFHFFREKIKQPDQCVVTLDIELAAHAIAHQRAQGFPLQYLLGYQFFYAHEFEVSTSTLIPRPETEVLVDAAIRHGSKMNPTRPIRFAELGLGSGAISIELLAHLPKSTGVATEISSNARRVALRNLDQILGAQGRERLEILEPQDAKQSYAPFLLKAPFDLFVSNPPYLTSDDEISEDVRAHEPSIALFPASLLPELHPNYYYNEFARFAAQLLAPSGVAFFEVPHERAQEIEACWQAAGMQTALLPDLTGRPRVLKGNF